MIKDACAASLDVEGQKVKSDHITLRLVYDPLTHLVVGIRVRMKRSPDLSSSGQGSSTSWKKNKMNSEIKSRLDMCNNHTKLGTLIKDKSQELS